MKHLFLVNSTDFIWALSQEQAVAHFVEENKKTPDSCEQIPDDRMVYLYQDFFGFFFDLVYPPHNFHITETNSTYKFIEQKTVREFCDEWCEDAEGAITIWSLEDWGE